MVLVIFDFHRERVCQYQYFGLAHDARDDEEGCEAEPEAEVSRRRAVVEEASATAWPYCIFSLDSWRARQRWQPGVGRQLRSCLACARVLTRRSH